MFEVLIVVIIIITHVDGREAPNELWLRYNRP